MFLSTLSPDSFTILNLGNPFQAIDTGPGPLVIPISVAIKLFTLPTALNIYIYISFNEIEAKQKINLYITYILKTSSDRKSFEDEMLLTLLILFKQVRKWTHLMESASFSDLSNTFNILNFYT